METKQRNIGIDLLRIISMVFIMILHILGQGGVLKNLAPNTLSFHVAAFIESMTIVGVNVYALITGFVMAKSRPKPQRLLELWLEVIFYSWLFFFIFVLIGDQKVNLGSLETLLPVTFKNYWYFNAYIILMILTPIINTAIKYLGRKLLVTIIAALIMLFSFPGVLTLGQSFFLEKGYSTQWLVVLYLIGAYIRLYNPLQTVKKTLLIFVFVGGSIFTYMFGIFKMMLDQRLKGGVPIFGQFNLQYNSIFIVISSVALFELCRRIEIKNLSIRKMIISAGGLSFAAYLIQTNPLVFNRLFGYFGFLTHYTPVLLGISVLVLGVISFILFIGIDYLRCQLFRLVRVRRLVATVADFCMGLVKII